MLKTCNKRNERIRFFRSLRWLFFCGGPFCLHYHHVFLLIRRYRLNNAFAKENIEHFLNYLIKIWELCIDKNWNTSLMFGLIYIENVFYLLAYLYVCVDPFEAAFLLWVRHRHTYFRLLLLYWWKKMVTFLRESTYR